MIILRQKEFGGNKENKAAQRKWRIKHALETEIPDYAEDIEDQLKREGISKKDYEDILLSRSRRRDSSYENDHIYAKNKASNIDEVINIKGHHPGRTKSKENEILLRGSLIDKSRYSSEKLKKARKRILKKKALEEKREKIAEIGRNVEPYVIPAAAAIIAGSLGYSGYKAYKENKKKNKEEEETEEEKRSNKNMKLGAAGLVGGGLLVRSGIRSIKNNDDFNDRIHLYHGTRDKNDTVINTPPNLKTKLKGLKIKLTGLDGKHTHDKDTITQKVVTGMSDEDRSKNLVYLSHDKDHAKAHGKEVLRVNLPKSVYSGKNRVYTNPEFNSSKTFKEFLKHSENKDCANPLYNIEPWELEKKNRSRFVRNKWEYFHALGGNPKSTTAIFEGKIKPKYIRGPRYNVDVKEIRDFAKSNPEKFKEAINNNKGKIALNGGKILLGTATIGTGAYLIHKHRKKKKESKENKENKG